MNCLILLIIFFYLHKINNNNKNDEYLVFIQLRYIKIQVENMISFNCRVQTIMEYKIHKRAKMMK